ncbi:uncharacterized protein [Scyliorhinus torazame]|uniref:uncharacterized protein n=1 Tax=Scyliorhinus torazame TaxID=75743 RepID=UPI003B5CD41E
MLRSSWTLCGLLLCLIEPSLQKGVPPRANGRLGQAVLPALMRGAGPQPGRAVGPMASKGIGPRMMLNGYGMARGQQLAAGAMGNGGKGPKPQGYLSSDGFPRGPLSMGVPAGLGMKRKPGYGLLRSGYSPRYQNGYRNGQAGQQLAFRGKQGKAPGYTTGVGSRTAPVMVQPAYTNGYRNGYINGYGPGYSNGVPNGAALQPGAGGKGLGPTGYGGTAGLTNGYGGTAGLTNGYGAAAGLTNGYGAAAGLTNENISPCVDYRE